jgi:hypothetical protein
MGEVGRTPYINNRAGRDHYIRAWTIVLSGGGIKAEHANSWEERVLQINLLAEFDTTLLTLEPCCNQAPLQINSPIGLPLSIRVTGRPLGSL